MEILVLKSKTSLQLSDSRRRRTSEVTYFKRLGGGGAIFGYYITISGQKVRFAFNIFCIFCEETYMMT